MRWFSRIFEHISYTSRRRKWVSERAFEEMKGNIGCFCCWLFPCPWTWTYWHKCTHDDHWCAQNYFIDGLTQRNATQPKWMNKEEKRRCKRTQRSNVCRTMNIWFHHICTFCSDLSFACDECTLLFCDALLKQMIPLGVILQTSMARIQDWIVYFPIFGWKFVYSHTIIFCDILNKRFSSSDMMNDCWFFE